MCGIFGLVTTNVSIPTSPTYRRLVNQLFKLSESRGKESAGIALLSDSSIKVYKRPVPASDLLHDKEYLRLLYETFDHNNGKGIRNAVAVLGHTRLVTNGSLELNKNNQPVIKDGIVGIHNGIIVNDNEIWESMGSNGNTHREYEVDTEVILLLIRLFINETGSIARATQKTFDMLKGSASIATIFNDKNQVLLATNTGSLYIGLNENNDTLFFASEMFIINTIAQDRSLTGRLGNFRTAQVRPGNGYVVNLSNLKMTGFNIDSADNVNLIDEKPNPENKNILELSPEILPSIKQNHQLKSRSSVSSDIKRLIEAKIARADSLKRCTKCLLPETMPFIDFDKKGTCNYCRSYVKMAVQGKEALEDAIAPYRSKSGEPDCIVTFSGGRDSSYSLHYVKEVLKMNPIAYSYDWGMITDLARRNQARICGQLGIEHILVSADIKHKRENIRKNILAWLKHPDPGTVPLFMAGDKQYFYYANKLRSETGIKLIFLCENPLEKTDFKSGFCGIRPKHSEKSVYAVSIVNKIKLAAYYGSQFLSNPAYLNSSLLDTAGAYLSYYVMSHNYLSLYQYIPWIEEEVSNTLIDTYDWEVANDTRNTWRIGDGTAPFYNSIYFSIAGFTENDTFRSNQIREGILTREEALAKVKEENQVRFESFQWYCDTIGIDYEETLRKIYSLPSLCVNK